MGFLYAARENARDVKWMGARFLLRHLKRPSGHDARTVARVRGVGDVVIRRGTSDLGIVREIFRESQYRIPAESHERRVDEVYEEIRRRSRKPLIIDAGANIGASAMWLATRYPEASVVAVEPDAGNAELCRMNTARFGVHVREAAIGSRSGRVSLLGSGRHADAVRTTRTEVGEVAVVTVEDLVADMGDDHELFLVKVDIEGFEADLFAEATSWVDRVALLYVEPHDYLFPGAGVTRGLQATMADRDFELLLSRENLIYVRR